MAASRPFWIWHHREYHHKIRHTQKPLLLNKNEVSISIGFGAISKNVENAEQKWPPVGHFESDINGNITTRFVIAQNPIF